MMTNGNKSGKSEGCKMSRPNDKERLCKCGHSKYWHKSFFGFCDWEWVNKKNKTDGCNCSRFIKLEKKRGM